MFLVHPVLILLSVALHFIVCSSSPLCLPSVFFGCTFAIVFFCLIQDIHHLHHFCLLLSLYLHRFVTAL
ncbi:hypothetical protein IW262DRAFT_577105 [Armillaria fumosa]|nr:hypothetical protein IW262DRAFT_577105 [Armillaria fumosa]